MNTKNDLQSLWESYEKFKQNHKIAYKEKQYIGKDMYLMVAYNYYFDKMTELLLLSDYPSLTIDEAKNVMLFASMNTFKELVESMAEIQINKNIKRINQILKQFTITKKDLAGMDIMEIYDSTIFALSNLTYMERDPILLFEQFITEFSIEFKKSSGKYKFRYRFANENSNSKSKYWYYANTIQDILQVCSHRLLQHLLDDILYELKSFPIRLVNYHVASPIDFSIIQSFKENKELFDYLNNIEIIKINIPLQHVYILLYYKDIKVFKDKNIMDEIARRIKMYPKLKNCSKTSIYLS